MPVMTERPRTPWAHPAEALIEEARQRQRRRRRRVSALVTVLVIAGVAVHAAGGLGGSRTQPSRVAGHGADPSAGHVGAPELTGAHVFGWGFDSPVGLAASGDDLFVANSGANSLTELDASTGAVVRVISGHQYAFDKPSAMVVDRNSLFVANVGGGPITELNVSDGALVRVIAAHTHPYGGPGAIALDGADLYVADVPTRRTHGVFFVGRGSITELNATSGTLVRVISGWSGHLEIPVGLAVSGQHVFVANATNGGDDSRSVAELNASTGKFVRVLSGDEIDAPLALLVSGSRLFVANEYSSEVSGSTGALLRVVPCPDPLAILAGRSDLFVASGRDNSVTEINASTGAVVRVMTAGYGFNFPDALDLDGHYLFVMNNGANSNSVTEINTATGAFVREIQGSSYHFTPLGQGPPDAVAVSAGELFVANTGGTSVTEVNASTGAAVRVISGPAYQLDGPYAMAVSGDDLFVANSGGNSVTALNASTGQLVTVFSGQAYEPSYPQSNYEGQAEGGRVPLPKRAASLVLPAAVASGANCAHAK